MTTNSPASLQVRITDPGPLSGCAAGNFFFLTAGEVRPGVGPIFAEVVASAWSAAAHLLETAVPAAIKHAGQTNRGTRFVIEAVAAAAVDTPFLDSLSEDQLRRLRKASKMRTCKKGEVIIAEGSAAACLFMIDKGQADVERGGQIVATLPRGSVFGEMSILTGQPAVATVRSHGMSVILAVDKDHLEELLASSRDLHSAFSSLMAARLASMKTAAASDGDSGDGIYGTLTMIEPADLVQSMIGARRTGELSMTAGGKSSRAGRQGKIWFTNGQACGAMIDDLLGADAFHEMLSWREGKFAFRSQGSAKVGEIECDTMALLMESMRLLDESSRAQ